MKIEMIESTPGSIDGIKVEMFKAGEVYIVSDSLANSFIRIMGVAREYKDFAQKRDAPKPYFPEKSKESKNKYAIEDTN